MIYLGISLCILASTFFVDVVFNSGAGLSTIVFSFREAITRENRQDLAVEILFEIDKLRDQKVKYTSKEVPTMEESAEYQVLLEKIEDREKAVDKLLS
jgi:hypothetical protein